MDDDLRAAVASQAAARVRRDEAQFASYMTPQATLQLGSAGVPRGVPRRFEIGEATAGPGDATDIDVRYAGSWSYVLRTSWQRIDGRWTATRVELVAGSLKASLWRRLFGRATPPETPQREELS